MDLICPRCSEGVPGSAVNVELLTAKCPSCDAVFGLAGRLPRSGRQAPRPPTIEVDELPPAPVRDAGYRVGASTQPARGKLTLKRRWFSPMAIFFLLFGVVWSAFLVNWYSLAFTADDKSALFFPIIHVAAGVWILYFGLAKLLNSTVIAVDGERLTVRHGPIPWIGNRDLPVGGIRQLFVRERVTRNKRGTSTSYVVCAEVDGTLLDLVKGLATRDEARYIEQRIEEHLAIPDEPDIED